MRKIIGRFLSAEWPRRQWGGQRRRYYPSSAAQSSIVKLITLTGCQSHLLFWDRENVDCGIPTRMPVAFSFLSFKKRFSFAFYFIVSFFFVPLLPLYTMISLPLVLVIRIMVTFSFVCSSSFPLYFSFNIITFLHGLRWPPICNLRWWCWERVEKGNDCCCCLFSSTFFIFIRYLFFYMFLFPSIATGFVLSFWSVSVRPPATPPHIQPCHSDAWIRKVVLVVNVSFPAEWEITHSGRQSVRWVDVKNKDNETDLCSRSWR